LQLNLGASDVGLAVPTCIANFFVHLAAKRGATELCCAAKLKSRLDRLLQLGAGHARGRTSNLLALGRWAARLAPSVRRAAQKGSPGRGPWAPGFPSLELQNVAARLRTCRATPSVVSAVADPSEHIEQVEFERVEAVRHQPRSGGDGDAHIAQVCAPADAPRR
jgi:hypothetical protein